MASKVPLVVTTESQHRAGRAVKASLSLDGSAVWQESVL
jgi:hypothetical protein